MDDAKTSLTKQGGSDHLIWSASPQTARSICRSSMEAIGTETVGLLRDACIEPGPPSLEIDQSLLAFCCNLTN